MLETICWTLYNYLNGLYFRFGMPFNYTAENVGFRCARSVPETHKIKFGKGGIREDLPQPPKSNKPKRLSRAEAKARRMRDEL